jgi:hypothetical protein
MAEGPQNFAKERIKNADTVLDHLKDGLKEVGSLVWSKTDPGQEVGKQAKTHDHLHVQKFCSLNTMQTTSTRF